MWDAKRLGPLAILAVMLPWAPAQARTDRTSLVPPGWSVRHVRLEGRAANPQRHPTRVAAGNRVPKDRELTIQRRFDNEPDFFFDGAINYGNVRLFNPVPSIDSGRQLPYGLDGIGGYGSDYGTSAGQDTAVYDRGP